MDLIDRQAAIDALNVGAELLKRVLDDADVVGAEREKYEWGLGLTESYISDMKELPPAQPEIKCIAKVTLTDEQVKEAFEKAKDAILTVLPERKKGKWILKPNIYGVVYCSECDYELHTNNTNYCPNCGADMRDNKKEDGE